MRFDVGEVTGEQLARRVFVDALDDRGGLRGAQHTLTVGCGRDYGDVRGLATRLRIEGGRRHVG